MWFGSALLLLGCLTHNVNGLIYDEKYVDFNLNTNKEATDPIQYDGEWKGHTFHPSPDNWRFPFYTLMLDRFVNGDPMNDNANGTVLEQDITGTQLRFGGDVAGLVDTLDYLQGMGIKGLYFGGSMLINHPWNYDSYSPLDHTLMDFHFGNITEWQLAIAEVHKRGMYIVFDNTVATLGDLIGYKDYLNTTAPFKPTELEAIYKTDRHYLDWTFPTKYNDTCENFPRLYYESGYEVGNEVYDMFGGCYDGDFDQFGDTEAFGVYPDYRRQLTKFASVQDRLREWVPAVNQKLGHFSCMMIKTLDIDGFRYDKALQVTVDAQGEFSKQMRECAKEVGKDNFFLPGEITGGNTMGSIYIGRGRHPEQWFKDINTAYSTNLSEAEGQDIFIRDNGHQALDSAAFHYSFYRFLVIFLGMDGTGVAGYDVPSNFVEAWNEVLRANDLINANNGKVDPRHMYGAMNQDTFRWPAIELGHERSLMGLFVTTLHLPGIPMLTWGEEQAYYVLDNTAQNYMFGRQPMSSAPAWQQHGCYSMPATLYYQMPLSRAREGCNDDTVSWDHRDPAHPFRLILKHMYWMREQYPVFQDGMWLEQLSNHTEELFYPGNSGMATVTGLFSVMRYQLGVQDMGEDVVPIWLLYSNYNVTKKYEFDCSKEDEALISPFEAGTTVKNLFFPHDEIKLEASTKKLGYARNTGFNGCTKNITMTPFEFRAYVPKADFKNPPVMLTKFSPGHDFRIESNETSNTVPIEFHSNVEMDPEKFKNAITFRSHTDDNSVPSIDENSIKYETISQRQVELTGALPSVWSWKANLINVKPGVHEVTVTNATVASGNTTTGAVDHFLFRIGSTNNPIIFPATANYSSSLLTKDDDGTIKIKHTAAGASKFRYSTNFESSWSDWANYETETVVKMLEWNGTEEQKWEGDHVIVQYWSRLLGTAAYKVHADIDYDTPRRIPHMFAVGKFNQFGYDSGLTKALKHTGESMWEWHYMDEWPNYFKFSIWGMNPDKMPDQSFVYGDVDGDNVVERLPPSSLYENAVNITSEIAPPKPYLAFKVTLNDATLRYELIPAGNMWVQFFLWLLLFILPIVGGLGAVQAFKRSFYQVKFNERGVGEKSKFGMMMDKTRNAFIGAAGAMPLKMRSSTDLVSAAAAATTANKRKRVLIATMEYNIDDWNIKIKIGGLGVMAQLMGKALKHQDLIWVVPCVGDVEYPMDQPAPSMFVKIMDQMYEIKVQYHQVDNITYVLLDAPVFRKQTKSEPYPPRMDDLESAIYYSAWNQCIADTVNRFPVDLYHINDYHGTIAPLYLLPRTIPVAVSLHNAEFQGLWPMRTPEESKEVCKAYNLDLEIVKKYVQYGSVFNLLHASASYLRIHQNGFGAVGVSKKYGDRSFARYPIFWGLSKIGQLPNPDPTDTADWDKNDFMNAPKPQVDPAWEASRGDLRRQAQEWAGLKVDPEAELFVFVGRWSLQKGVDLIADVFPQVLEKHPKTQLITIGPVIDLYGKFAALKLAKLMELYPGRVFSKPEFTALPPYIFSGAEFALIPSRDEPFGLVAVEFGRKGALGVGARVGGLGQMPGWWFTVESTKAAHLTKQFKSAIESALASDTKTRAEMRAYSAKQRFPVAEWLQKLEKLQAGVIKAHAKYGKKGLKKGNVLVKHSRASSNAGLRDEVELVDRSPAWMRQVSDYDDDATLHTGRTTPAGMQTPAGYYSSTPGSPIISPSPAYVDSPGNSRSASPGPHPHSRNISGYSNYSQPDPQNHSRNVSGFSMADTLPLPPPGGALGIHDNSSRASMLSVEDVVGDRHDYKLQQVDPFFTDQKGEFYHEFEERLKDLNPNNSISELCIEDYLMKSEKEWFDMYLDARLGRPSRPSSPASGRRSSSRTRSPSRSPLGMLKNLSSSKLSLPMERGRAPRRSNLMNSTNATEADGYGNQTPPDSPGSYHAQFALPDDYVPPTGVKKYLQYKLGDWPVYAMLLALNQIIATNSYQVTLLTGEVGQTASKLYVIASIYLAGSLCWYTMSRTIPLLYPLSAPYIVYGIAFLILGCSPFAADDVTQVWLQNVATGLYAFASASGSLAFAFNFGTDGGSTVPKWIQRLAIIQGLTQLYTLGLWAWGSLVSEAESNSQPKPTLAGSPALLGICLPVALLLWAVGALLYLGLPDFYRESPGPVPQLWQSLVKRKTIAWYILAVAIQNYFLSPLFGRNWFFLFSSQHVPVWSMVLLALFFFTFVWAIVLWGLAKASASHPWLFPMFAVGLGAPRWAQIWWGTSRIGVWMPWAGGVVAGAVLSRILWLWLGVLDGLQGAGIGMILMLTLTRVHVAAACAAAQVVGSIFTMLARATAPNNVGPGPVFPDVSEGVGVALSSAWFWVVLLLNLGICIGYFKFFRKEQVSKP